MKTPTQPRFVGATPPPGAWASRGRREGGILLVFTVLTLAISAYVLISAEHDAVHDPVQKAARGEIKGLDPESLLREGNGRKALPKADAGAPPVVSNNPIAPERIDATV